MQLQPHHIKKLSRSFWRILASSLLGLGIVFLMIPLSSAATFTVDDLGDATDFAAGDGVCDTNDGVGDGPCTLRAAIEEANALANAPAFVPDSIIFTGLGGTISLGSALPTITESVSISGGGAIGYSSSGVQPDGGMYYTAMTNAAGIQVTAPNNATNIFTVAADNTTISGLAFAQYNVAITVDAVQGTFIIENFFGTDGTGTPTAFDQNTAIAMINGANSITIGQSGNGNLFLDHDLAVITIDNASFTVTIDQNTFGTDRTLALDPGVGDRNDNINVHIINGLQTSVLNNRFVRAGGAAIRQDAGGGTLVKGNVLGIGIGGLDLPNAADGINMTATTLDVNYIGTDSDGFDDATEGNVIVNSALDGVIVDPNGNPNSFVIAGNLIGTTTTNADKGNGDNGIELLTTGGGRVGTDNDGTSDTEEINTIVNSTNPDISVVGQDWTVRGNDIGIKPDGTAAATTTVGLLLGVPGPPAINNTIDANFIAGYSGAGDFGLVLGNAGLNTITSNVFGVNRSDVARSNDTHLNFVTLTAPIIIGTGNAFASSANPITIPTAIGFAVTFQGNVFGASLSGAYFGNTTTNLSIESDNHVITGNTFHFVPAAGPFLQVDATVPTAQSNSIRQNNFIGTGGLAIDLFPIGANPDNATYVEAGQANQGIDIPTITIADIKTFAGTSNANAIVDIYRANTAGTGLTSGGNYVTSTTADASGNFSVNLAPTILKAGDFVSVMQSDAVNSDSSEFGIAVELTSSGGRRVDRTDPVPTERPHPFADLPLKVFLFDISPDNLIPDLLPIVETTALWMKVLIALL